MKQPYIYLIIDKNKNRPYYVGKHNGELKNYITSSKILKRYISIYGIESFLNRFDRNIIEYCLEEEINDKETYYIKYFKTKTHGGNLTWGGIYDYKNRCRPLQPVLQYDIDGNFIKEWKSGKDIWRSGIVKSYGDISACCKGKQLTAGGFRWVYKDKIIEYKIKPLQKKEYKKNVKRIKNQKIEINGVIYPSITAASRDLGLSFGKLNWDIKNNKIDFKWIKK